MAQRMFRLTLNKVWIVPQKAVVYESKASAYVVESKLKVMLEEDYLALEKNTPAKDRNTSVTNKLGSDIVREVVIPILEKEVNEGKNFAQLRQVFNSLILAVWYKDKVKASIFGKAYIDQKKTGGVDIEDKAEKEKIWAQYVEAFNKGAYNYIKEDVDPVTQQPLPRKYFSGGVGFDGPRFREGYEHKFPDPSELAMVPKKSAEMAMLQVRLDMAMKTSLLTLLGEAEGLANQMFNSGDRYYSWGEPGKVRSLSDKEAVAAVLANRLHRSEYGDDLIKEKALEVVEFRHGWFHIRVNPDFYQKLLNASTTVIDKWAWDMAWKVIEKHQELRGGSFSPHQTDSFTELDDAFNALEISLKQRRRVESYLEAKNTDHPSHDGYDFRRKKLIDVAREVQEKGRDALERSTNMTEGPMPSVTATGKIVIFGREYPVKGDNSVDLDRLKKVRPGTLKDAQAIAFLAAITFKRKPYLSLYESVFSITTNDSSVGAERTPYVWVYEDDAGIAGYTLATLTYRKEGAGKDQEAMYILDISESASHSNGQGIGSAIRAKLMLDMERLYNRTKTRILIQSESMTKNAKGLAEKFGFEVSEDGEDKTLFDTRWKGEFRFPAKDKAMNGGIDLARDKMDLQVQGSSVGVQFNFDPAMIQQLQDASGLTPVIIDIQPMSTTVPMFLGLKDDVPAPGQLSIR